MLEQCEDVFGARRAHETMKDILECDPPAGPAFYRPPGAPLRPTCLPNYERKLIYYSALAGALAGTLLGLAAAWVWTR